ncbi:MAG: hypothetical protein ACLT0Y_07430 [Christensenellales bacterium]
MALLRQQAEAYKEQAEQTAGTAEALENSWMGKSKTMDAVDNAGEKARVARMETIRQQAVQRKER